MGCIGVSSVFPGEKLPPLDRVSGHVLHGWRDLSAGDRKRLERGELVQGWPHEESLADGHRWYSERAKASLFPKSWSDQQVVDAVRDAIENPSWTRATDYSREVWREIDGVVVYAKYLRVEGAEKLITAYPERNGRIPKRTEVVK